MCKEAVEDDPEALQFVPDNLKTQRMSDEAVEDDPSSLEFVPDWFVTQKQLDMWHDYYYHDDGDHWNNDNKEDKFFECYDDYKKWKAQKAKLKEQLFPIAWHPECVMDWCMSEDEKGWWK